MARPYRDAAELSVRRADKDPNGFVDHGTAWIVLGVIYPGAHEPLPVILDERYEYRIRCFYDPARPPGWTLERRAVATRRDGPDPD